MADALKRPFYVAVESYKFARMYPLSQKDTLKMTQASNTRKSASTTNSCVVDLPTVDFTPAKLITLLFTDLGVLTPAAVSDELIRLYQ